MKQDLTEHELENEQELATPLTITIRTPSKKNMDIAAWNIIKQCEDGEVDPLELIAKVAAIQEICEQIKKGIKDMVLTELDKQQGKAIVMGVKLDKKEVGTKMDYTSSPAWVRNNEVAKGYADKVKEVEKIAKTLPDGISAEYPDPENGEMLKVVRASKTSDTSFAVTLPK